MYFPGENKAHYVHYGNNRHFQVPSSCIIAVPMQSHNLKWESCRGGYIWTTNMQ